MSFFFYVCVVGRRLLECVVTGVSSDDIIVSPDAPPLGFVCLRLCRAWCTSPLQECLFLWRLRWWSRRVLGRVAPETECSGMFQVCFPSGGVSVFVAAVT